MRHLIRRLFPNLNQKTENDPQGYAFDSGLIDSLQTIADREERSIEEVAEDLLSQALHDRYMAETRLLPWRELSPRLQQITALACLGFTNGEIALRLKISSETVKTHMRAILKRFNVHSKAELRHKLQDWDFGSWE